MAPCQDARSGAYEVLQHRMSGHLSVPGVFRKQGGTSRRGDSSRGPATSRSNAPMNLLDLTGYAAALCTTGAFVPQVVRVWRTRSTEDISLKMFLILATGLVLWLVYGVWKGEFPIVAANGVTLVLAGTILFFKLRQPSNRSPTPGSREPAPTERQLHAQGSHL